MTLTPNHIMKVLLIILAFTIQSQITLFKSDDYIGLRINATDLLLPFIGLLIFISLITKRTLWPQFAIKGAYIWLIGLGSILIAALLNSYYSFGELSSWGLQNKIIGWAVLSGLFLMGSWIGTNAKEKDMLLFFMVLAIFLLIIVCIQMALQVFRFSTGAYLLDTELFQFPISAFMANKNSFIFLFLTSFSFLACLSTHSKNLQRLAAFSYFLLPLSFLFTGARSAFIVIPILLVLSFVLNRQNNWKKLLSLFLSGLAICVLLSHILPHKIHSLKPQNTETLTHIDAVVTGAKLNEVADDIAFKGDSNRLNILHHVFGMIKEKPLLGSGLGSILITQIQENGSYIDLMDCTALWLWAETGLIGLLFFLTFYVLCFHAIWKKSRNKEAPEFTQAFCKATILMLITFGIMSLFHELLYTRFLWVFLGIALTLPVTRRT